MSSPRVLVLSGSAGNGHVMAGEAVSEALRVRHPTIDVAHLDGVEKMDRWFAKTYRWTYHRLIDRHPYLWRALYDSTDRATSFAAHALSVAAGGGLVDACRRWKPHAIVCTHFLAPEVLSRPIRRARLDSVMHAVVTDYDCHRNWYWPEVSHYYVASDLVKARLTLRYGVAPSRISVTGIPVRSMFLGRHDARGTRSRLGLDPSRPVVMFLTGGFAAGDLVRSIVGLWLERRDAQVLAVCGRNERLRRRIAALPRPAGAVLHALGFVGDVPDLMAVSDVLVSKSGGITVSECLAMRKPLVISGSIPGQEERNADALIEAGAAVRALTPEEVRWRLARLLEDSRARTAMSEAAATFGKPNAAATIADEVARSLGVAAFERTPRFHGAF